jgi:hypothetical protein
MMNGAGPKIADIARDLRIVPPCEPVLDDRICHIPQHFAKIRHVQAEAYSLVDCFCGLILSCYESKQDALKIGLKSDAWHEPTFGRLSAEAREVILGDLDLPPRRGQVIPPVVSVVQVGPVGHWCHSPRLACEPVIRCGSQAHFR